MKAYLGKSIYDESGNVTLVSTHPVKGGIFTVVCLFDGVVEIEKHNSLGDSLDRLALAKKDHANWGKAYQVRDTDGKYIFNAEFQQRFNI